MKLPTIKLVGGPHNDVLIQAKHPWPRASVTVEGPDGVQAAYHLNESAEGAEIVLAQFFKIVEHDLD